MVLDKFRLDGKVAIVTGGGTGLGKAMALALAGAGADLAVAARRLNILEETAAEARALGRQALAIATDVTDSSQVNRMVERVIAELGHVDILVNNAGIVRGEATPASGSEEKPIWEISDQEWRLGIDTNLTGTFYCSRAVLKHMVERGWGRVINVSSGHGIRGGRGNYMYCAAKAGVQLLTQVMALSYSRYGINVNCIVPGYHTTRVPQTPEDKAFWEERQRLMPAGRTGHPRELGPLAIFLASEASSYITGELFIHDGGALAGGIAPTLYAPVIPLPQEG